MTLEERLKLLGLGATGTDPLTKTYNSIDNYQTRLANIGYQAPVEEKKTPWWLTALQTIDKPRNAIATGIANAMDGGDFSTGLGEGWRRERDTYGSDFVKKLTDNKIAQTILGFGVDVALDPITYASFGLGSLGKGIATRSAVAMGTDAAIKSAGDTLLNQAGRAMSTAAKAHNVESAMYTGANTANDLVNGLHALSGTDGALDTFRQALTRENKYTQKFADFLNATPKAYADDATSSLLDKDGLANAVSSFLDQHGKEYGMEIASQFNKSHGVGVHIPFTNKGVDVISGETMRKAGAKVGDAMSKVPGLRTLQSGMGSTASKLFNKYSLPKTSKSIENYLRQTEIARTGSVDFANEEELQFMKKLFSKKELRKYLPNVEKLESIYKAGGEIPATEYINSLEDSPFKQLVVSHGKLNGNPLRNVDMQEYTAPVAKSIWGVMDGSEMDDFMKKNGGLTAQTKVPGTNSNNYDKLPQLDVATELAHQDLQGQGFKQSNMFREVFDMKDNATGGRALVYHAPDFQMKGAYVDGVLQLSDFTENKGVRRILNKVIKHLNDDGNEVSTISTRVDKKGLTVMKKAFNSNNPNLPLAVQVGDLGADGLYDVAVDLSKVPNISQVVSGAGKGSRWTTTPRFFGKTREEAIEAARAHGELTGNDVYIVQMDNLQAGHPGSRPSDIAEKVAQKTKDDPTYRAPTKIVTPENSLAVYKINPKGTDISSILEDMTPSLEEALKEQIGDMGKSTRIFKQKQSELSMHAVKQYMKFKDGKTFVPKMRTSGSVEKYGTYEVWENGKKIDEIEIPKPLKEDAIDSSVATGNAVDNATTDAAQAEAAKPASPETSKVVDEAGKPLTVYHGSTEDFDVFDKSKIRSDETDANYNGFWFSTDKSQASPAWTNAKHVKAYNLDIKNPAPMDVADKVYKELYDDFYNGSKKLPEGARSLPDAVRMKLQDMGYDGVIHRDAPKIDWNEFEKNGEYTYTTNKGSKYQIVKADNGGIDLNSVSKYGKVENITGYLDKEDFIQSEGYKTYVAFEPSQIKAVDETAKATEDAISQATKDTPFPVDADDAIDAANAKAGALTPEEEASLEKLQQYGFKDFNDFEEAVGTQNDYSNFRDVYKEVMELDANKMDAATKILETPELLYSNELTTHEQALRTVGALFMDKLRIAGMQERNISLIGDLLDDYVPHVMSWEKIAKDGQVWDGGMSAKHMANMNLNSLGRKYRTTIDEANAIMAKQGYGDNYFETNIAKAYMTRMVRHNKVVYDQRFLDRILGNLGVDVSGFDKEHLNEAYASVGMDIKGNPKQEKYIMVVPKASIGMFSVNKAGVSTLNAMIEFMDNSMKFSDTATKMTGVDAKLKEAYDALNSIKGEIDRVVKDAPEAGAAIESMLGLEGGDIGSVLEHMKGIENINSADYGVLQQMAKAVAKIPKTVTKFRDTQGLKSTLENLANPLDGALTQIDEHTMSLLGAHVENLKAYLIPEEVYKYVNKTARGQYDEGMNLLTKSVDKFNQLWKVTVTSMIPSFHIRNFFGGMQQNAFEFGVKCLSPKFMKASVGIAAGKEGVVKLGGREYTYSELRQIMSETRVNTPFFKTEANDLSGIYKRQFEDSVSHSLAKRALPWNVGRDVGNFTEQQLRATNFMAWLDEGIDPLAAAERTKSVMFDYTELSDAERRVFKRIMPFYTFFRKNFAYQLENILNRPGQYAMIQHGIDNAANANDYDMSNAPEWLTKSMALPLGKNAGGVDKFANLSMPASDAFGRSIKDIITGLNPALITPMELYSNQNFLNGAPITKYPGQTTEVGGINIPNEMLHVMQKVGVIRNGVSAMNSSSDDPAGMFTSGTSPLSPASAFGIIKNYDESKGELNAAYAQDRELGNIVQMLKDKGVDVPTVADTNKVGGVTVRQLAKAKKYSNNR